MRSTSRRDLFAITEVDGDRGFDLGRDVFCSKTNRAGLNLFRTALLVTALQPLEMKLFVPLLQTS